MTSITVQTDLFHQIPITRLEMDGRSAWLAREIGQALGYPERGDKLARNIVRRWNQEFEEGVDYDRLTGESLQRLRGLVPRLRRTRRVLILFQTGLEKVLARTPYEISFPLRTWIEEGVRPESSLDLLEERRLRWAEEKERRLASEQRARGLVLLIDAISETATKEELRLFQIKLAQELAGRDFSALIPTDVPEWSTPSQIAKRNGTSLGRVARAISDLGLRDPVAHPGLVESYKNLATNDGRQVVCYRYSPEAVAQIEKRIEPQQQSHIQIGG